MQIGFLLVPFLALAILQNGTCAVANATATPFAEEETVNLLVTYKNDAGRTHALSLSLVSSNSNNATSDHHVFENESKKFQSGTIRVARKNEKLVVKELLSSLNVESVEIDNEMHALNRAKLSTEHRRLEEEVPYGVTMVQADQLWANDLPPPSDRVVVCVVDTGYGLGHPDLPSATGWHPSNKPSFGRWNVDGDSHGTHCAGTIGALGNNGRGVVGVIPQEVSLFIAKGLSDAGSGSDASIMAAMEACATNGARVISMSLGGTGSSSAFRRAVKTLYNDENILLVAAAGNAGNNDYLYPASYPHVLSVAAVDQNEDHAYFSQVNDQVELAGPGVSVLSTITDNGGSQFGYALYSGTSMATPHVAGVAALIWSYFPECSNHQIRNVLLKTSKDLGESGCDEKYGFGIVQAKAAYDLLSAQGCSAGVGVETAVGGCAQDPNHVPPPPPAPPVCAAANGEKLFELQVTTDRFGSETTWTLQDANGQVVKSGGPYENVNDGEEYHVLICLDTSKERFTFTIRDSWGDGICCGYGGGSYKVSYDNLVVKSGDGRFGLEESVTFPEHLSEETQEPTSVPTSIPTPRPTTESPTSKPTLVPRDIPVIPPTLPPVGTEIFFTTMTSGSNRQLYAETGKNERDGVGADAPPLIGVGANWTFQKTTCPGAQDTPTCFLIVHVQSGRRLYATDGMDGSRGFGASSSQPTNDERLWKSQHWYLKTAGTQENIGPLYWIANSWSERHLYAGGRQKSGSEGVGARLEQRDWKGHKWHLPGMPQDVVDAL